MVCGIESLEKHRTDTLYTNYQQGHVLLVESKATFVSATHVSIRCYRRTHSRKSECWQLATSAITLDDHSFQTDRQSQTFFYNASHR